MNTYENEMMAMLRQGMSMDEVMNKMRTQLANAQAQIKAEEEAKRKQAEAEAKRKADNETKAKTLVDLCNRAMENKLTAADVAYVQQLYAVQKYPEHARMFDADEVDSTIKMAMNALTPLVHLTGAKDWNEVFDELDIKDAHIQANAKVDENLKELQDVFGLLFDQTTPKTKAQPVAPKSDDTILRDFVNSIKK